MSGTSGKPPRRQRYRPQEQPQAQDASDAGREQAIIERRLAAKARPVPTDFVSPDEAQEPGDGDPFALPIERSHVKLDNDPGVRLRQVRTIYGRAAAYEEALRIVGEFLAIGMTPINIANRLGVSHIAVKKWVATLRQRMGDELRDKVDPYSLAGRILARTETAHQKAMAIVHSQDKTLRYANRLRALELAQRANMDMLSALERMGAFKDMRIDTDAASEDPAVMEARTVADFFNEIQKSIDGAQETLEGTALYEGLEFDEDGDDGEA
jgi:hypothetical protein